MNKLIIGVDMGHSLSGAGSGAIGIKKETDMNRLAGKRLIAMLQEKGHTVINCTVDSASTTDNQLVGIVQKANAQTLDIFISLHLNSFADASANGVETYIWNGSYSNKEANRSIAKRINDELASKVGWYNRGIKEANYYVLRVTKSPAILVELGFCSNKNDMDKWDTEKIAKALFKGITGVEYDGGAEPAPAPILNEDKIISQYSENGYGIPRTTVNVRTAPSVKTGSIVATYAKGEKINNYDSVYITNDYVWISYVSYSGSRRYVAVKNKKTNERYVDCY